MIGRHSGNHPRGTWMSESFVLVRLGERPALGFHGCYTTHLRLGLGPETNTPLLLNLPTNRDTNQPGINNVQRWQQHRPG